MFIFLSIEITVKKQRKETDFNDVSLSSTIALSLALCGYISELTFYADRSTAKAWTQPVQPRLPATPSPPNSVLQRPIVISPPYSHADHTEFLQSPNFSDLSPLLWHFHSKSGQLLDSIWQSQPMARIPLHSDFPCHEFLEGGAPESSINVLSSAFAWSDLPLALLSLVSACLSAAK